MPSSNKHKIHSPKKHRYRPIVVSLFAGAGGFDLGFEQAGYDVRVAVERDADCCRTLRLNLPRKIIIEKDVKNVSAEEIFAIGGIEPASVFAVIGGPPCQGFSQIGKKDPNDPRNFLYREYFRIVEGLSPACFLMENTAALLFKRNRAVFLQILEAGMKAGYAVGYTHLNAADFGVPQRRQRCFIIGQRLPDLRSYMLPLKTVRDAIADLADKEIQKHG